MKRTEYDRALIGPDSYEYFNNLSKTCQNRYLRIVGSQLIILLLISLLAAIPATIPCIDKGKHILELSLIISVLVLMIIQFRSNYMDGWQKSRFLAESILSQTWLLLFKIDKYDTELNQALTLLQEKIGKMKKEVVADTYYKLETQNLVIMTVRNGYLTISIIVTAIKLNSISVNDSMIKKATILKRREVTLKKVACTFGLALDL
jgi:hypothetical protein